jgi:adenine-specific DNA-methyltransferase
VDLIEALTSALIENQSFVTDGKLSKDAVVEAALNMDGSLIELLSKNATVKNAFFEEMGAVLVFDKVKFQRFVQNKDFLPDSYTQFKINVGLATPDFYLKDDDRVFLNWPYKDCILEGGQSSEEVRRSEIFWNETLSSDQISRLLRTKALTSFKHYQTGDEASTLDSFGDTNNFVIKGNNLLVLHSLLAKYQGKIDVIYIDPPYYFKENKASDTFAYNSNFKFSSWLTFMKNRLEVSRKLLSKNGVIFISTNDDGMYGLKILCEEVFGIDNFITNFVWKKRAGGGNDSDGIAVDHEYILCYGNIAGLKKLDFSEKQLKAYKFEDSKLQTHGPYSLKDLHDSSLQDSAGLHHDIICPDGSILYGKDYQWKCNKETFDERSLDDRIVFSQDKNGKWRVQYKIYLYENKGKLIYDDEGNLIKKGIIPNAMLDGIASNGDGKKDLKALFPELKKVFSYPKPVKLIKHLLRIVDNKDAIILDFFAGSGTTAHAALDLNQEDNGNRKYILVEQLDYADSLTSERIHRAMNKYEYDSKFVYMELSKLNANFVEQIKSSSDVTSLIGIWEAMNQVAFLSYRVSHIRKKENLNLSELSVEDLQKFLLDSLENNMLYLPLSEIQDAQFNVAKQEIRLNTEFYGDDLNV